MKFTKNRLLSLLLVLAMMLALATTAFAEDGETPTPTTVTFDASSAKAMTVGETGKTVLASCNSQAEGTHTVSNYTSSDTSKLTIGTPDATTHAAALTANHVGTVTVTATCTCGQSATSTVEIGKGTLPAYSAQSLTVYAQTGTEEANVKTKLTNAYTATSFTNKDKLETMTDEKWTRTTATFANTKGTTLTYSARLNLSTTSLADYNAASVTITATVTFDDLPSASFDEYKVNGTSGTVLNCKQGETDTAKKTLSLKLKDLTDGATVKYQWFYGTSSNSATTPWGDETTLSTTTNPITCTPNVATAGTYYYVCKVKVVKNGLEGTATSASFTVNVNAPYKVTVTYSDGYGSSSSNPPRVGNTLFYTASATVYDPTASDANATTGYRPAKDTDKLSFTFSTTGSDGRIYGVQSGNSYSVYLNGAANTSANTIKVTATLNVDKTSTNYSNYVTRTYYPAAATNITINPISSNAALMDETSILSAVNSAVGSSIYTSYSVYRVNFTTSTTYGSFSTTGASSSTYSQNGYVSTATYQTPKINSVYFVPNSSYVGFPSTSMYVTYYAYDSTGYVLATGNIYFTSASSITYSTTASTPVYFKASDFSDYFKTALGGTYNSSYYTLSEVSFGTPRVSNSSVTSGTLYYNNGYISTTRVPAANLGYVSYTPSSSTYTYTVSIPFTAYGTYYYGSTATKTVSGTVTIKVNDGHVITMVGTDFKSASIWSDITSKHPGVSYVSFSQPQSTVGKLYYGYSSIASKGSLVSYTDRFNNSNYNYSYANTIKSIDGIYFVPAADCLDTVTLTYTAYTSATATTGVSDTITFTITKKTASSIFNDVTASNTGKWSADAIDFLARNSIVEGGSYGTFNPNGNMTRGDFVLMLYRMAGKPSVSGISNPFTDVKSSDYYYNAILWAYRNDIVTGIDSKTFAPKKNITREQIAATLYRMAGSPSTSGYLTGYYDYAKIHSYATNAMRWAISNGVITGSNGYLTPTNNATRAQVATMLHRYLTK